ncbi:fungal-specific transcription factor domain-containing protein [Bombardia bombarda]|uniref:Fungal-specific transcription factor domain-containing protein n=1 Tax=Bombardia bombarda TaxID=252184 RepID=A0AA39X8N4_9PEZI|nr:fungal-specific transcription factor domain-containing protein [Bombardia bombarda]
MPQGGKSRRAVVACKACNARKVRCTVALSGPPCANCTVDDIPCEVANRKRRHNSDFIPHTSPTSDEHEGSQRGQPQPRLVNELALPIQPPAPTPDAAQDSSAYADTLKGGNTHGDGVPFYPGDKRGPAFVIDICSTSTSTNNHFLVPMPPIKSLLPEDMAYLRAKGAFTLPPPQLRSALIRSYFHHVHPFSPILDPDGFILEYEKGRMMSLLLLWSMFLAAASFIDTALLTDDFYPTRRALKHAMYQRAKALYDADYEKDKITLIQSTFLMSHWYVDSQDRAGPWHWNGVALGLAHSVGLHRLPPPVKGGQGKQAIRPPFWRRMWWSIYCREVWLSLGQGRPMRIPLDDSDTPLPEPCDADVLSAELDAEVGMRYLPSPTELAQLFHLWMCVVRVTTVLGTTVLSMNYRAKGAKPTRQDLDRGERELRACYPVLSAEGGDGSGIERASRVVASHAYQVRLYFEAAIIVLYRPFIFDTPRGLPPDGEAGWRAFARQMTRTAASNATSAVNSIMAEDLMRFCLTISVLALVPPMQIHLFESTSSKPVARQMGKHNLGLCMLAMGELRESFISADEAYKLFETALAKVEIAQQQNASSQDTTPQTPPTHRPSLSVVVDPVQAAPNMSACGPATTGDWTVPGWPGGNGVSTAEVIAGLWTPYWNDTPMAVGGGGGFDTQTTNTEAWLDIQSMDRPFALNDFGLSSPNEREDGSEQSIG